MSERAAPAPSTEWKERIGEGEEAKHAELAKRFVEMQKRKSQRFGEGRALHRSGLLGLRGELKVRSGLPAHLAHGLFADLRIHANQWPPRARSSVPTR